MNLYSSMLMKAAEELHQFRSNEHLEVVDDLWIENLITRVQRASAVAGAELVERELGIILRMITDSGPLTADFSPSLDAALGMFQKGRKRSHCKK